MKPSTGFAVGRLLLWLLGLGLIIGGALVVAGGVLYQQFADRPLAVDGDRVLEIKPGDGFRQVLGRLREAGIDDGHPLLWRALAWDLGVLRRLQVGEYALADGQTPRELLQRIERGDVIQYRFTIVEGWNFRELRLALAAHPLLAQTLPGMSDQEVMRALDAAGVHPEGRFLPETYQFTRGMSDLDLLRRARAAMTEALAAAWARRSPDTPLQDADEALVLASIIEKETAVPAERREIAGVFARRIRLGMKLQTDPTVIYGVGDGFDGNLTRLHLATDTPWNTYTRTGLPPTPIAMPGREALLAAVDPAPGESLYFVARGDGSHVFSATLDEHNAAVRRYQLKQ